MTRWKVILIAVGIILMVYGGFLFAQPQQAPSERGGPPADRDPRMEHMIDMMFQDMDTNHDGRISKAEWMAFQEKQFKMLDRNGDGFITRDEVRADMIRRMRAQQQQQRTRPSE
ncbi:MAG: hypothetical protein ACLQVJ_20175 [Syntrophobacteraceae bacterium]